MGVSERQRDDKGAALVHVAADPNGSSVELDQFLDQRQADAAPFISPAAHILHAVETFEDAALLPVGPTHAQACIRVQAGEL